MEFIDFIQTFNWYICSLPSLLLFNHLSKIASMISDRNIDMDCLPNLSDKDYSSIGKKAEELMGPVTRLKMKVKELVQKGGANETLTVIPVLIDIKKILMTDIRGKSINDFYKANNKLTNNLRDLLITIILDHHFNCNMSSILSIAAIDSLSNEICLLFPQEDKVVKTKKNRTCELH